MKGIRIDGIRAGVTRALCRTVADVWAADPAWRDLTHRLIPPGPDVGLRIHRLVRDEIAFRTERGEIVQSPGLTLRRRVGDCDCKSTLVCALAGAHGLPYRLMLLAHGPAGPVTLGPDDDPAGRGAFHVWPQLWLGEQWHDCETCHPVEASHLAPPAFGEHPADVMARYRRFF